MYLISKIFNFLCVGTTSSYFYNVGFKPTRIMMIQSEEILTFPGYQLLFAAPKLNLYLKVHENTKPASKHDVIDTNANMVKCAPLQLLSITAEPVSYVQEEMVRDALNPVFFHAGKFYSQFLPDGNGTKGKRGMKINHEVIRTKAFIEFFLESELSHQFTFGHVTLPSEHVKYPYSMYGRSLNDVCIMHTTQYKSCNKAAGGIIIGLIEKDNEDRKDNNGNSKCGEEKERIMSCDDIINNEFSASLGVLEFKQKRFAVEQTVKEMLKSAGDLVAKVLTEGDILSQVNMYGLAVNYHTESALLVVLHLDFLQSKARILFSDDDNPVDMCRAMNWLLNAITLK